MLDVGLRRLFRCNVGKDVGSGCRDCSPLAVHRCFLLDVFNRGDNLTLRDPVAFLHVEVRDPAHGCCADIHIVCGLDLSSPADDGGKILPRQGSGIHLGVACLLPVDHESH